MNNPTREAIIERKILEYLEMSLLSIMDAINEADASNYTENFIDDLKDMQQKIEWKIAIVNGNLGSWEQQAIALLRASSRT